MTTVAESDFRRLVQQYRGGVRALPEGQQADLAVLCGSGEVLAALLEDRGVGIGRFAALMDLPVTTVRHLLREDLLRPVRVNGKFRFLPHNVIELRGVQQWQALGLTLEDTRAFQAAQGLLGLTAQGGTMFSVQAATPDPEALPALKASVLARVGHAVRSLEERYAALGQQLERARALERMVQQNAFGQAGSDAPPT